MHHGIGHMVRGGGGGVDNTSLPPGPDHNICLPPWDQVTTPPSPRDQVTTHSSPLLGPGHNTPPPRPGHNTSLPLCDQVTTPPPPLDYAQVGSTHPTGMHGGVCPSMALSEGGPPPHVDRMTDACENITVPQQ